MAEGSQYLEGVDHEGSVKVHASHPVNTGEGLCGALKSFPAGYEETPLQQSTASMINCKKCCRLIRSMGGVRMAPKEDQK